VERPRRKVRFAQLIQRRVRDLGGPSVHAACGGNLKPALVATKGDAAEIRLPHDAAGAQLPPAGTVA